MLLETPEDAQLPTSSSNSTSKRMKGLLLVGGYSTRMQGEDKAFLVGSDGQTLLTRGMDRLGAVCTSVTVSARQEQVERLRGQLPVECDIVIDQMVNIGPASGLLAAHYADPDATWLAFSVDYPLTPLAAFEALVAEHHGGLATCFENSEGFVEPLFTIWSPEMLVRLQQQVTGGNVSPSYALKMAKKAHGEQVRLIKAKEASWLVNANTPEEWAAAQATRRHSPSVTFAMAKERLIALAEKLGGQSSEMVELLAGVGRVCAKTITSPMSLPPFRNSAMDGLVVRSAGTREVPVRLRLLGTIAAGDPPPRSTLPPDSCLEIMTGAPLPLDASFDTVVRNEDYAAPSGKSEIELVKSVLAGQHVRQAGEDVARGRLLLKKGDIIRPAHVGVLSGVGLTRVEVQRKLRVGLLPTGTELSNTGTLASGQIYNSNGPTLAAFLASAGHLPVPLGSVADDAAAFLSLLRTVPPLDALIITGGVSAGKFDFVPSALSTAGANFLFRSVAMRPGHPCHVALLHDLPIFALPGNPLAALACYRFLAEPHLRARIGRAAEKPLRAAKLTGEEAVTKPRAAFVVKTGRLNHWEGTVEVLTRQGAGCVGSLSEANVWIALPVDVERVDIGEEVEVWPMSDPV